MDLGPHKVRVHAVCLGPILADGPSHHMKILGTMAGEIDAGVRSRTFVGRAGRLRGVAAAVLFSASSEASYSTGSQLMVDGGYSAQ